MFGNFLFGCSANREEMLNNQTQTEEPKKNGLVISEPQHYYYRDDERIGQFYRFRTIGWSYVPFSGYDGRLTEADCLGIAAIIKELNEQSTNQPQGVDTCK